MDPGERGRLVALGRQGVVGVTLFQQVGSGAAQVRAGSTFWNIRRVVGSLAARRRRDSAAGGRRGHTSLFQLMGCRRSAGQRSPEPSSVNFLHGQRIDVALRCEGGIGRWVID